MILFVWGWGGSGFPVSSVSSKKNLPCYTLSLDQSSDDEDFFEVPQGPILLRQKVKEVLHQMPCFRQRALDFAASWGPANFRDGETTKTQYAFLSGGGGAERGQRGKLSKMTFFSWETP